MTERLSEAIALHSAYFYATTTFEEIKAFLNLKSEESLIKKVTIADITKDLEEKTEINLAEYLQNNIQKRLQEKSYENEEKTDPTPINIKSDIAKIFSNTPKIKFGYKDSLTNFNNFLNSLKKTSEAGNKASEKELLQQIINTTNLLSGKLEIKWEKLINEKKNTPLLKNTLNYFISTLGSKISNPDIQFSCAGKTKQGLLYAKGSSQNKDFIFTEDYVLIGDFNQHLNGAGSKYSYKNKILNESAFFIHGEKIISKDEVNAHYRESKKSYRFAEFINRPIYPNIAKELYVNTINYNLDQAAIRIDKFIPKYLFDGMINELDELRKKYLSNNSRKNVVNLEKSLNFVFESIQKKIKPTSSNYFGYAGLRTIFDYFLIKEFKSSISGLRKNNTFEIMEEYLAEVRLTLGKYLETKQPIDLSALADRANLSNVTSYEDYIKTAIQTGYLPKLSIKEVFVENENKGNIKLEKISKGLGVIANEDIIKGELICQYSGKWVESDILKRSEELTTQNDYTISLGNPAYSLDGQSFGDIGRFLNDEPGFPNTSIFFALINASPTAFYVANYGIKQGTELCWYYGLIYPRPWLVSIA